MSAKATGLESKTRGYGLRRILSALLAAAAAGACSSPLDEDAEHVGEVGQADTTASYNGSTYYFKTTAKTWSAAQADCVALGGKLATINNAAEETWLEEHEALTIPAGAPWWIGLNDATLEGFFAWASGEATTYTNWSTGEPNNGTGNDDCVVDNASGASGKWNDISCGLAKSYICEVGSNATCGNRSLDAGEECDDGNTNNMDACRNDCTNNNGSTYYFNLTSMSYADALASCQSLGAGASLVTVNSAAEEDWLNSKELALGSSTTPWWIGYDDQAAEGIFAWPSGRASTYTNWNTGQPDNANSGEDCVIDNSGGTGKWNDAPCTGLRRSICEVGSNATCGNGVLDAGEACDDGNTSNLDRCRDDCTINNGSIYYVGLTLMTWADAEVTCHGVGGTLVMVDSAEEEAWLNTTELANGAATQTWWIGKNDQVAEGTFVWSSGRVSNYTNWNSGQPDNGGSTGNEDCVIDNASGTGKWNDISCTNTRRFICETIVPFCGDGAVDPGEACDDGNMNNADACRNDCSLGGNGATTYYFGATPKSWPDAQADCQARGGALVTVNSANEEAELYLAEQARSSWDSWWIGYNDRSTEGSFGWASGQASSFTNWETNEPNQLGDEDCVEDYSSGKWNDFDCSSTKLYICEIPLLHCGDGVVDAGEACDDGNENDADGCTRGCRVGITGGATYYFGTTPKSWPDAQADCQARGGALATVNNAAEELFLYQEEQARSTSASWWIGYNDRAVEGSFRWASDQAYSYTNWHPGEPNQWGDEDCVEDYSSGRWNDSDCAGARFYICEIPGARCGDGVVSAGEACDDGNANDADGCHNDCTRPSAGPECVPNGDFQGGATGWTATGAAFNGWPQTSCINGTCFGYGVNTLTNGESATGTMVGSPFTIQKHFICWQNGGYGSSYTAIDVDVNGSEDIRIPARGTDGTPSGDSWGEQCADVGAYIGHQARLVLVDNDTAGGYAWAAWDNFACNDGSAAPICGDGIVDPGEACDDGNTNNTDACRDDCTLPAGGFVQTCVPNGDFQGGATGWTATGAAFNGWPQTSCINGTCFGYGVNTLTNGEAAIGTLVGAPFTISQPRICWQNGGYGPSYTAIDVDLNGNEDIKIPARGIEGTTSGDSWGEQCADVGAYLGHRARVVLVDNDAAGAYAWAAWDNFACSGGAAPVCGNGVVDAGEACDDGNTNDADACHNDCTFGGSCPAHCTALDACHDVGTCNPATGQCTNPVKANGAACDDGIACTQADTCQSGVCVGGSRAGCTTAYTYDTANRLVGTTLPDGRVFSYEYDGAGQLVAITENDHGVVLDRELILDESGSLQRIVGEVRSDGTEVLYAFGPEGLAAQGAQTSGVWNIRYPVVDHLGSVRALVNGATGATDAYFYDPFGAPLFHVGPATQAPLFGFTGEPTLPDGNVYLRARVYSPELGRFLQRDTFRGQNNRPQSLNRYAYADGNPMSFVDPSGHFPDPMGRYTNPVRVEPPTTRFQNNTRAPASGQNRAPASGQNRSPTTGGGGMPQLTAIPGMSPEDAERCLANPRCLQQFSRRQFEINLAETLGVPFDRAEFQQYLKFREDDDNGPLWACYSLDQGLPTAPMCAAHGVQTFLGPNEGMYARKRVVHAHGNKAYEIDVDNPNWSHQFFRVTLGVPELAMWAMMKNVHVLVIAACNKSAMAQEVARNLPMGYLVFGAATYFETARTPNHQPMNYGQDAEFYGYFSKGTGVKPYRLNKKHTLAQILTTF